MRVRATKARWFARLGLGAAAALLGCGRSPRQSDAAACQTEGIVSSRTLELPDAGELSAQIVQAGCRDCRGETRPGTALGSPCSAASVCAEACCACPGGSPKSYYRARVCASGACADRASACAKARALIRPDVCQP